MSKPVIIDGMLFHSVKDACEFYNIPYASVTKELQMHPRTAEAIIKRKIDEAQLPKKAVVITYKGNEYTSIPEAIKDLGLDPHTVYDLRWRERCTYEEAFDYLLKNKDVKSSTIPNAIPVTVDGVTYPSTAAACRELKILPQSVAVFKRIHKCTSEEAIHELFTRQKEGITRNGGMNSIPITIDGVKYESISAACRAFNLSQSKVCIYKSAHNCTYEEAIAKYRNNDVRRYNAGPITINGVNYESLTEACATLNLNRSSVVNYRHATGCTREEAVLHFVSDDNQRRPFPGHAVEYKGVQYASVKGMCEQLGISLKGFEHYRRRHNTSIEETVDMYLSGKIYKGCHGRKGGSGGVEVPETLPEPIVEDTTEYEDTIPDDIETDLQKWRMSSRIGKRALVGVADAAGYSKWVMDSRTKLSEPFEIFPDKEKMPWLSFKSIAEVIEKADVDEEELAYLIYVCGHDAMASIVICRENTESQAMTQTDEIDKLKKEIKSLKSEINSHYCHECGERISEEFLKTHPGTKYCVNCFDKHI